MSENQKKVINILRGIIVILVIAIIGILIYKFVVKREKPKDDSKPEARDTAVIKLTELAKSNTKEMFTDDTEDQNIRYMGKDPANYVYLGDGYYEEDLYIGLGVSEPAQIWGNVKFPVRYTSLEKCKEGLNPNGRGSKFNEDCTKIHSKGDPILWRIIGVMNNVDDGTGNKETRIKLIRDESIGEVDGDYKSMSNDGKAYEHTNNWKKSLLNQELNESFYNSTKTKVKSFISYFNTLEGGSLDADFTNLGLNNISHQYIADAVYYLGGPTDYFTDTILLNDFYKLERSNSVYRESAFIGNPTTWTGKVGLMYPSDYGYATSGGVNINKKECDLLDFWAYNDKDNTDCVNNNWIIDKYYHQISITPFHLTDESSEIIIHNNGVVVDDDGVGYDRAVRPVVYLKSDVKITDGDGTKTNPYKLSL